ncbi:hypothetical protein Q5752_001597 [Cryptotrichosporon argae]
MVSLFSLFRKRAKPKPAASPPSPGAAAPKRQPSAAPGSSTARAPTPAPAPARFTSLRQKAKSTGRQSLDARRASSDVVRRSKQRDRDRERDRERDRQIERAPLAPPALPRLDLDFGDRAEAGTILDINVSGIPELTPSEVRTLDRLTLGAKHAAGAWAIIGPELARRGDQTVGIMLPRRLEADDRAQRYLEALLVLSPDLGPQTPEFPSLDGDCQARLAAAVRDASVIDLADVLRWTLRHLDTALVGKAEYVQFVQAEHAASYPPDAYADLVASHVSADAAALLDSVFDLVAALSVNAAANMMSAGRLCHLLGWWVVEKSGAIKALQVYDEWAAAGQALEHLFYAWIRWQSTTQALPLRLLRLVRDYPFGESSASAEHLPLPPPSSFPRRTLHLALATPTSVAKLALAPRDIIRALDGVSGEAVQWSEMRQRAASNLDSLFNDSSSPAPKPAFTPKEPADTPTKTSRHVRRRSASTGQPPRSASSPSGRLLEFVGEEPGLPLPRLAKRTSLEHPDQWSDFAEIGFGEASEIVRNLSLAVPGNTTPTRKRPAPKLLQPPDLAPKPIFMIAAESMLDLDDGFLAFTQDAQADGHTHLAPFALVQLNKAIAGDMDWLLVTVEQVVPPPQPKRPTSPGAISTTSRFGSSFALRDLTSFRRSASTLPGARRSFWSGSGKVPAPTRDGLAPVSESANASPAMSTAPTDYTVGEMGELVKIPSRLGRDASRDAGKALGIAATTVSDWRLLAEGGKHVVLAYAGSSDAFMGKALRLRKGQPDTAAATLWLTGILPRLLGDLVVETTTVALDQQWLDELASAIEATRSARRSESGPLLGTLAESALLMPDLTAGRGLTTELKPKWGFLPLAEYLTPPESVDIKANNCRFCLHQYLRGEERDVRYCPLDLYSLDKSKMKAALAGLWEGWQVSNGSRNNLLVFLDGKPVVPSKNEFLGDLDMLSDQLVDALLSSGVLAQLKQLQASLDPTDITGLAALFREAHPDADLFDPTLLPEITEAELEGFMAAYNQDPAAQTWSLRQRLIAYVLSAIFKDCSIMIQLGMSLRVVDLDLKPIHNLRKWYDLDEQIWRHWAHTKTAASSDESTCRTTPDESASLSVLEREAIEGSSARAVRALTPGSADAAESVQSIPRSVEQDKSVDDASIVLSDTRRMSLADALAIPADHAVSSFTAPVLVGAAAATTALASSLAEVVHELMDHGQPVYNRPASIASVKTDRPRPPEPSEDSVGSLIAHVELAVQAADENGHSGGFDQPIATSGVDGPSDASDLAPSSASDDIAIATSKAALDKRLLVEPDTIVAESHLTGDAQVAAEPDVVDVTLAAQAPEIEPTQSVLASVATDPHDVSSVAHEHHDHAPLAEDLEEPIYEDVALSDSAHDRDAPADSGLAVLERGSAPAVEENSSDEEQRVVHEESAAQGLNAARGMGETLHNESDGRLEIADKDYTVDEQPRGDRAKEVVGHASSVAPSEPSRAAVAAIGQQPISPAAEAVPPDLTKDDDDVGGPLEQVCNAAAMPLDRSARSPGPEPDILLGDARRRARSLTPSPPPHVEARDLPEAYLHESAPSFVSTLVSPIESDKAQNDTIMAAEPAADLQETRALSSSHLESVAATDSAHPVGNGLPPVSDNAATDREAKHDDPCASSLSSTLACLSPPKLGLGLTPPNALSTISTPSDFATPSLQAYAMSEGPDDADYFAHDDAPLADDEGAINYTAAHPVPPPRREPSLAPQDEVAPAPRDTRDTAPARRYDDDSKAAPTLAEPAVETGSDSACTANAAQPPVATAAAIGIRNEEEHELVALTGESRSATATMTDGQRAATVGASETEDEASPHDIDAPSAGRSDPSKDAI